MEIPYDVRGHMPVEYKYKGFGSMARVELRNNHEGVKVYDEVFTETG